jgi:hypothetical protein
VAKKDDIQLAKQMAIKRIRSAVRLELGIRADVILNDLLDSFGEEYDRRVAAGEPYELTGYQGWIQDTIDARVPLALVSGDSA